MINILLERKDQMIRKISADTERFIKELSCEEFMKEFIKEFRKSLAVPVLCNFLKLPKRMSSLFRY